MIPVIPADKANHALYGAALACAGSFHSVAAAIAACALAAVVKEALDYLRNRRALAAGLMPPHGVELADALATAAGGALVVLPLLWGSV